ncbi:MAG: hypothetical protein U7M05_10690 [Candidatus Igneacidithiobacillus chanchocoensis]
MQELCQFFDRRIYHVEGGEETPAVYYIADKDAGGILVNAPVFCEETWQQLASLAPPTVLFLPSRFGAQDLVSWRERGLRLVAQPVEGKALGVELDIALDSKLRLTRTIDFLPMSGRTAGSCALRLRNKPGAIFFGPILEPAARDAWPTLLPHTDDQSWENRLFGSLGLQDVSFAYAFCDRFFPGRTPTGPGADAGIAAALHKLWADD